MRLSRYLSLRMLLGMIVASAFFLGAFVIFVDKRTEFETQRLVSLIERSVDNAISAYLESMGGYELFFEQAMEHFFKEVLDEATNAEDVASYMEEYLKGFRPTEQKGKAHR